MILVVVASSVIATFLYKDQLINQFIREANKQINTPINVGKISVSSLSNFPHISLTFDKVVIQESFANSTSPLLEAEQVSFTFNPIELYRGQYSVRKVIIRNAKCHLKINEDGVTNYAIVKKDKSDSASSVVFDLSSATLENVDFKYSDFRKLVFLEAHTSETIAKMSLKNNVYSVSSTGAYDLKNLQSKDRVLMYEKMLKINADIQYDHKHKIVSFNESSIEINSGAFLVTGSYAFAKEQELDFKVVGDRTDIQTILSILPEKSTKGLVKYRSKGDVYFSLFMKGNLSEKISPGITINFGLRGVDLYHPETMAKINSAYAEGTFAMGDMSKSQTASLTLKNIKGQLEGNEFLGDLTYTNFSSPLIKLNFDGVVDINSLFKFYKTDRVKEASGVLDMNVSFNGRLNDLKNKTGMAKIKTSGDITLLDVSLNLEQIRLPLEKLNGNLLFNNNDLALSDVSGKLGNSDFKLNGFFKNVIAYLLFENEPVGIESELESNFIDMDELLTVNQSGSNNDDGNNYRFGISKRLRLKFNCDVKSLKFRRFTAKNIEGDLKVKDQIALTDKLQFGALGGATTLSGLVDAKNNQDIQVSTSFKLEDINIDSVFYVFENFNQNFLEDRHLKGKIFASIDAEMDFNDELELYSETLTSNISTTIKDGELNNFEPMQRLSKYLDEDKLDHLIFSELTNDIHIENKIIYLPTMQVGTNVTDINIGGTHTFGQKIDYSVVAPLRSKKKIDPDEAFGAIEEDTQGRTKLYLKIIGTTSDYRIIYDKKEVKKKIISDLKKEADELKRAFKEKGLKKKKTVELEEDDYFDWDDHR